MDISTLLGLIVGFGMLILGFVMEKGQVQALFLTSPAIIVFGGTLGALMVSYTIKEIASIPRLIKESLTLYKSSVEDLIEKFVDLSEIARKEGLLSLENALNSDKFGSNTDPMLMKGIKMVIDGVQAEPIKDVLETEVYLTEQKRKAEASIFEAAGGYSPTMGIIGTVMGLVHVLGNISDAEKLAPSIASAFIATLYGVSFANLVYLPIASKLKLKMKQEKMQKELIIEGILSLHAGENPLILREKLGTFLLEGGHSKQAKKQDEKSAGLAEEV